MPEANTTGDLVAIDAGAYYHREALYGDDFGGCFDRTIYAPDLPGNDLAGVGTLVVTCRTSSVLLGRAAPDLRGLLDRGGTLVVMGECGIERWMPELGHTPGGSNYWWWLDPEATLGLVTRNPGHGLFAHITLDDATWHFHGRLTGPPGAVAVIEYRGGGALLIDDSTTWNGRLIATTLDPFYHHGSFFMPAASRFLRGFLPWLRAGAPTRR